MRNLRVLGVLGLAAMGLAAACGGSSESKEAGRGNSVVATPASAEPVAAKPSERLTLAAIREDPCRLVTRQEAEALFGRAAQVPSKGRAVGAVEATCGYAVETTRPSEVRTMTISIMFSPDRVKRGMDGKRFMEGARQGVEAEGGVPLPISGLGDEAFCVSSASGASIFSRTGDVVLTVGGNADDCVVTGRFAETAIARL